MVNIPELLQYLERYDIGAQDHTTLGHLRTWLNEAIAQHTEWLECIAGNGAPEFEAELASEIETLKQGQAAVETAYEKPVRIR